MSASACRGDGIDALMALYDPKTIRIDERTKANRATINGVSLLPMSNTLEMGKKIAELRTRPTVDAISKAMRKQPRPACPLGEH